VRKHLDDIYEEQRNNGKWKKPNGPYNFKDSGGRKEGERFDDSDLIEKGWTPTVYDYKLPDGKLLYQQNRYDAPEGRAGVDGPDELKKYLPTRPIPDDDYFQNVKVFGPGQRRIPYNWSAIINAGPGATVFVTEGEKNADDLTRCGLLATTVISHDWADECVAALTGYDVIILADHDKKGEQEASRVQGLLSKVAKSIRVVPFLHLWKKISSDKEPHDTYDVSDWLACGGNADRLIEICRELPADGSFVAVAHEFPDEKTMPLWEFLYGKHLLRRTVSATAATGGTGKSSKSIVEALAMTTGRPLLKVTVPREPIRVLLINLEDNREAVDKRIAAVMKHYKLTPEDIGGRLFTKAKGELSFKIATQAHFGLPVRNESAIRGLIAFLLEKRIDVLSIDPFIATHGVIENDNTAMRNVIECYDAIAEAANCAVSIWHHTRKGNGQEASIDSARGAGAFADACRAVRVLETMTKAEAKDLGLEYASSYFRSFSGKLSFAPPADKSDWFHFVSVSLNNGGGGDVSLEGDDVGVVEAWDHPMKGGTAVDLSMDQISEIRREIAGSEWREDMRSDMWAGKAIATALNMDVDGKARLKSILSKLILTRNLKRVTRKDKARRERVYIECV
jgi:hypothetical protein